MCDGKYNGALAQATQNLNPLFPAPHSLSSRPCDSTPPRPTHFPPCIPIFPIIAHQWPTAHTSATTAGTAALQEQLHICHNHSLSPILPYHTGTCRDSIMRMKQPCKCAAACSYGINGSVLPDNTLPISCICTTPCHHHNSNVSYPAPNPLTCFHPPKPAKHNKRPQLLTPCGAAPGSRRSSMFLASTSGPWSTKTLKASRSCTTTKPH
jgi:hypothetical protein